MSGVILYYSSVSSNLEIKKHQQRIELILDGKKIPYTKVDISADESAKQKMRQIANNPSVLPPILANGEQLCGGYDDFDYAVESEALNEFLKI